MHARIYESFICLTLDNKEDVFVGMWQNHVGEFAKIDDV